MGHKFLVLYFVFIARVLNIHGLLKLSVVQSACFHLSLYTFGVKRKHGETFRLLVCRYLLNFD